MRILFLAANPDSTAPLHAGREVRRIRDRLAGAARAGSLEIVERWAVRPGDLQPALLEVRPHVVHFSGHGNDERALMLEGEDGSPQPVSHRVLAELFRVRGEGVRLVVLSACHSLPQAEAIAEHVDCAIGMARSIGSQAAMELSAALYHAIASGDSVQRAFEAARLHLQALGIPEHRTPQLVVRRDGVDPERIVLADLSRHPTSSLEEAFVSEYRTRLKAKYIRWDLAGVGAAQAGSAGRPAEATLDSMYVPLRLGAAFDAKNPNDGAPLGPDDLLARDRALVICGAACSGKTTWMRFMFRKLIGDPRALPFMLELRRMAYLWSKQGARGPDRTLDAFLRDWVAESGASGSRDALPSVLKSATGPRPVLLVDGWDEVGEIGEALREQLTGFLAAHPRALAIVTSRPYGDSRPSRSEGFERLEIQPLSDEEIAAMSRKLYRQVYGEDEEEATRSTARFLEALEASPEAKSLTRTALLLTMMLLISRGRPLPDTRHRLYEECLRSLLSARPDQKEAEGALLLRAQWRPADSEERLRAVAEMAFRMQKEGYCRGTRALTVRPWTDLERWLPAAWRPDDRGKFLAWLVGPAGVLVDRADGTLSFAHLSFQEYLTALHLSATTEGEEDRRALCREYAHDTAWWETLRLWVGIMGDRSPEHATRVVAGLITGDAALYWLAGAMLADGQGAGVFDRWVGGLRARFHADALVGSEACARAWAASRQGARIKAFARAWPEIAAGFTWFQAEQAEAFRREARLPCERAPNHALEALLRGASEGQGVGRGRALMGASPLWPGEPVELLCLRLWPSRRRDEGVRLQTLVSLGAPRRALVAEHARAASTSDVSLDVAWDFAQTFARAFTRFAWHLTLDADALNVARDFAGDVARAVTRAVTRDYARAFTRELGFTVAQSFASDFVRAFGRDIAPSSARTITRDVARDFARDFVGDVARDFVRDVAQDVARDAARSFAHDFARDVARNIARAWGAPGDIAVATDFALAEVGSVVGRYATRAGVVRSTTKKHPTLALLQIACRQSLRPGSHDDALAQALERSRADGGDPLWPALARHIARLSSPADRALLDHLARHPEERAPPVSWGLKYYVRGDLVLDDGREITLDELSSEAGLPRLPHLEDMPDELEIAPGR